MSWITDGTNNRRLSDDLPMPDGWRLGYSQPGRKSHGDDCGSSIGSVLRRARIAVGMRQDDLARMLGISKWTLNRVEHGNRRFDINWVLMLPLEMRSVVKKGLIEEVEAVAADATEDHRVDA